MSFSLGRGALICAALFALAGCSSADEPAAVAPSSAATTPAAVATSAAPVKLDAKGVAGKLKAAGLFTGTIAVQDEATDPNKKLGRPGQYTSRASFDLPGGDTSGDPGSADRGAVLEVFPDAAAAKARADFIQKALANNPMLGSEYDYLNGGVLLRITGKVLPSEAKKFEAALAKI